MSDGAAGSGLVMRRMAASANRTISVADYEPRSVGLAEDWRADDRMSEDGGDGSGYVMSSHWIGDVWDDCVSEASAETRSVGLVSSHQ